MSETSKSQPSSIDVGASVVVKRDGELHGQRGSVVDRRQGWYRVRLEGIEDVKSFRWAELNDIQASSPPAARSQGKPQSPSPSQKRNPASASPVPAAAVAAAMATMSPLTRGPSGGLPPRRPSTAPAAAAAAEAEKVVTRPIAGERASPGHGDDRSSPASAAAARKGRRDRPDRKVSAMDDEETETEDGEGDSDDGSGDEDIELDEVEGWAADTTANAQEEQEEEEEEEEEEEMDMDAMIQLAAAAARKHQASTVARGSSGGAAAAGGGQVARKRPRVSGVAPRTLDSGLASPKYLTYSGTGKGGSLTASVSNGVVDGGKAAKLMAGSALYSGRDRAMLLERTKAPKDDTAGKGWYNMEQAEMTPELKRDLQVIRMRNYVDPKRFYKASDKVSKFMQIGTVKEGPAEYFSSRMTNKERKKTLVDELLVADDAFRAYSKSQYRSIQSRKRAGGKAAYNEQQRKRKGEMKWKP